MNCMKKKFLMCVLAISFLIAVSSVIVVAAQGFSKAIVDSNGKVVDIGNHFEEDIRKTNEIKEQIINEEEQLKANPSVVINSNKEKNDADLAALREKAEQAEKNAAQLRELFENGTKIVNQYSDKKLAEKIDNLQEIDRDMLEAMVVVLEENLLTQSDANILKECLAQKYFIVLTTDPIYQRINAILEIEP